MNDLSAAVSGVLIAMLGGVLKTSTPSIFISLGEIITEKSGRINLGLEGVMIFGAVSGFGVSFLTGNPYLGVLAAGFGGCLLGFLHGWLSSYKQVNMIALGIAIMIFGQGISFFMGKSLIQPQAPRLPALSLGFWTDNPGLKEALEVNILFIIGVILAPCISWFLKNTRWGFIIRMTGENTKATLAMGYNVNKVRILATAAGGFLGGVGGSFLSLYYPGSWTEGLSNGQGLMAVALVIFAKWKPMNALWSCLLFGAIGSLGAGLQAAGISEGFHLFNAAPAMFTIIILFISSSRNAIEGKPEALILGQDN